MEPGISRAVPRTATPLALVHAVTLACLASLATASVRAHDTAADHDAANDWIEGLRNSSGEPCCGTNDCRPLGPTMLRAEEGSLHVLLGDRWFAVTDGAILGRTSPDGRTWACPKLAPSVGGGYAYTIAGVRCLLLPDMSFIDAPGRHFADGSAAMAESGR